MKSRSIIIFYDVSDFPICLKHSNAEMYADDTNLAACSDELLNLQTILN